MTMFSLRLVLLAWSGALCFAPLAWTGVMESASQQNQVLSEEFDDPALEDELDNQENILTQVMLLKAMRWQEWVKEGTKVITGLKVWEDFSKVLRDAQEGKM